MKYCLRKILYALLTVTLLLSSLPITTFAEETENSIVKWPTPPEITSEGAVVIEASTGCVLYDKSANEAFHPASTTKLMTSLLAIEQSMLSEIVTCSHDAIYSIGWDSSRAGLVEGEQIDMENALYAILLASANEVSYAVAEHAAALLLASVRRIHKAYNRTRDFNFSLNGLTGFDFHGKTVGVVGTGKIGRIFINICRGFGMHVIAFDKFPVPDSGIEYVDLDELFTRSDIISLHCPLTEETRHMIGSDAISKMKKGVVIVNTSRGALIDAEALLEGIKARKVGAACLDVYEEEADIFFEDRSGHILNDDLLSRLISMPNVIVTSHQAFLTEEALGNIADTTVKNILSCFENDGICDNELCYRCGDVEACKKARKQRCF